MAVSRIRKRIEKLAAKICPASDRNNTLEGFCRLLWRCDERRFLALAKGDCPYLRVFVSSFERDDAERVTRGSARISVRKAQK